MGSIRLGSRGERVPLQFEIRRGWQLSAYGLHYRFSRLSWLSLVGFAASCLTTAVTVEVFASNADSTSKDFRDADSSIHFQGLPIGLGIYSLSLAGHACLPAIYSEMRYPEVWCEDWYAKPN